MRICFCGFPQLGAFLIVAVRDLQFELFVDLLDKKTNIEALAAVLGGLFGSGNDIPAVR